MNVEVVQRRLWEQSQQHRELRESSTPLFPVNSYDGRIRNLMDLMHQPQWIAAACDRVLSRSRGQDTLESRMQGKLARPVWGWGRGEIPRPTPLHIGSLAAGVRAANLMTIISYQSRLRTGPVSRCGSECCCCFCGSLMPSVELLVCDRWWPFILDESSFATS